MHVISLVTPTWVKDAFFWYTSGIFWQGGTLSCLAAVLYFFHIFLMVGSRLPAHTPYCSVQFKIVCAFLLQFSLQYLVKGRGPPLPSFSICPKNDCQPADRTSSGGDGLWTALELEGSRQILLLPHAATCAGRGRKKEIRRENAICRSLSPVLHDIVCLPKCN